MTSAALKGKNLFVMSKKMIRDCWKWGENAIMIFHLLPQIRHKSLDCIANWFQLFHSLDMDYDVFKWLLGKLKSYEILWSETFKNWLPIKISIKSFSVRWTLKLPSIKVLRCQTKCNKKGSQKGPFNYRLFISFTKPNLNDEVTFLFLQSRYINFQNE